MLWRASFVPLESIPGRYFVSQNATLPICHSRRPRYPRASLVRISWVSACAAVPGKSELVKDAAKTVYDLYGDVQDENMEFWRWNMAQDAIEESGLKRNMISTELTYGEFSLEFFGESLLTALEFRGTTGKKMKFVDIGSGYGRLAHYASLLLGSRWETVGLEIVPQMHAYAEQVREEAAAQMRSTPCSPHPWPSRLRFVLGDYRESGGDAEEVLRAADILFCFCTTWPSGGTPFLTTLTSVLGQRVKPGSILMTVDKQLALEPLGPDGSHFELLRKVDGVNRCVGESTVFFYRFCEGWDGVSDASLGPVTPSM